MIEGDGGVFSQKIEFSMGIHLNVVVPPIISMTFSEMANDFRKLEGMFLIVNVWNSVLYAQ